MNRERVVRLACGLLLAAALLGCWWELPLTWDGAYQLAASLVDQRPYVYQTRFHSWFAWWPCVALSRLTDNLTFLTFAFGLPFLAAPAASLWLSWRVVHRHRPDLVVCAAFGTAIAGLPGQVFVINDSILQQTLFWPVFLGMLVPLSRRGAWVLGGLAILQLPHQVGILLLATAAIAAFVTGCLEPARRGAQIMKAAAAGALLLVAVAKAIWVGSPEWSGSWHDSYAVQQASWPELRTTWCGGVAGAPIIGMAAMWLAAFLFLSPKRLAQRIGLIAIIAALALWAWWAAEPERWAGAISYRRWVVPLAAPFYACALFAARRRESATDARLILAPAVVFAIVIGLQSFGWQQLVRRFVADVAHDGRDVVPRSAVAWVERKPIDHWAMTALMTLHQGKQPAKYFAFDDEAFAALRDGKIWLGHGRVVAPAPGPAGFFDHRRLLDRWREGGTRRSARVSGGPARNASRSDAGGRPLQ